MYNGYNFVTQSVAAVHYREIDSLINVSNNIGFYSWFNLNNYVIDENHNIFTNYNEDNNLGWKVNLKNDNIKLNLNSDTYTFSFTGSTNSVTDLYENVWYCYVLNIDQRNRNIEQWIYKRNVEIDSEDDARLLPSTVLEKVYHNKQDMVPVEFEIKGIDGIIYASDMKMTNIRLFSEIIPESQHTKILNQYIIADDSKYLIFADNANTKLTLPYYPLQ